jgi:hypothetical protein
LVECSADYLAEELVSEWDMKMVVQMVATLADLLGPLRVVSMAASKVEKSACPRAS